jgi:hypothetical protein
MRALAKIDALARNELATNGRRPTPEWFEGKQVRYLPANAGQGRAPDMIERASKASGDLLGESYGALIYSLLRGVKQGSVSTYLGRILLERILPSERPTPVELPVIDCAADLLEGDRRLMRAANSGAISHREWAQGQSILLTSWQIRREAKLEEP